jgi:hypothetical protein
VPVAQLSSVESFIHRDYAFLFATVPAIALGSISAFVARDRATARAAQADAAQEGPGRELALAGVVLALMADRLEADPLGYPLLADAAARLVPFTAEPADLDSAGDTRAARAADARPTLRSVSRSGGRSVWETELIAGSTGGPTGDLAGLTSRARRAAVDVIRPLALSTLIRAALCELAL